MPKKYCYENVITPIHGSPRLTSVELRDAISKLSGLQTVVFGTDGAQLSASHEQTTSNDLK